MKFAAIDIGSNAVRLLFCNVFENNAIPIFKKSEFIRFPLRLGDDAFIDKQISEDKAARLVMVMKAFKNLIDANEVIGYRACATSAMRDANNGAQIIERIKNEANLTIEIIDGKTEADIIYSNHIAEGLDDKFSYLYIDVGGGSTELTLFSKTKMVASQSFNIGTIRLLHNMVNKQDWENFKDWVKDVTASNNPVMAIGTGGNINNLFKMSGRKNGKPLSFNKLSAMYDQLNLHTYDERIRIMGLNPDRADVIIPAAKIFLAAMKRANAEKILVPQIGLSDGIIHKLYEQYKQKEPA